MHPLYDYCSDALIIEGRDVVHRAENAVVDNDNTFVAIAELFAILHLPWLIQDVI
jgi:hypothetical protein